MPDRFVGGETKDPVGCSYRHDLTAVRTEGTAGEKYGVAKAHAIEVVSGGIAIDPLGDELEVALIAQGGDRSRIVTDAEVARWDEGNDLNRLGRKQAIERRPLGDRRLVAIVEGQGTAERFIADDTIGGPEHVAIGEAGAFEQPVVWR